MCSELDLAVSDTGEDDEIRFRRKIQMRHAVPAGMYRSRLRLGWHIWKRVKVEAEHMGLGLQVVLIESSHVGGAR